MRGAGLDPRAILRALGHTEATAIRPVPGGSAAAIWRVAGPEGCYALRVFPPGAERASARELLAMRSAGAAGIPVPAVHAAGSWEDRPALLLSWLPGRPMAELVRRRPWLAWRLGEVFGRMQAAIHGLHAPSQLGDPDAWIVWAGPIEPRLQARLRSAAGGQPALLHLDYHPFNVLTDGRRVTGVLDWENARPGDPQADVARTLSILRADLVGSGPRLLPERAVRLVFEQGWRRGYRRVRPLGDLDLFCAWAGAVMERDLAGKRQPADLARIRRWGRRWERRAGCG